MLVSSNELFSILNDLPVAAGSSWPARFALPAGLAGTMADYYSAYARGSGLRFFTGKQCTDALF